MGDSNAITVITVAGRGGPVVAKALVREGIVGLKIRLTAGALDTLVG